METEIIQNRLQELINDYGAITLVIPDSERDDYGNEIDSLNEVYYKYTVPRGEYQDLFANFIEQVQEWVFNHENIATKYLNEKGYFKCNAFSVHHYIYDAEYEDLIEPNFIYNKDKIAISWYKYPLRSATSNIDFNNNYDKFKEMINDCLSELNKLN